MDHYLDFSTFFNERLKQSGTTIRDIAQETGISIKHLEALCDGRYEDLPAAPYLHGYLVKLSALLDFDAEEWWERIKTETGLQRSGAKDILPLNRFVKKIPRSPWLIGGVIIAALFLVIRFPKIIGVPELTIAFPSDEFMEVYDTHTRIVGTVENANTLYINKEQIQFRSDGTWDKELLLQPGMNTVEISANKLLGRETSVIRQIFYVVPLFPATTTLIEISVP